MRLPSILIDMNAIITMGAAKGDNIVYRLEKFCATHIGYKLTERFWDTSKIIHFNSVETFLAFLKEFGDRESVMKIATLIKRKQSEIYSQPQKLQQLYK